MWFRNAVVLLSLRAPETLRATGKETARRQQPDHPRQRHIEALAGAATSVLAVHVPGGPHAARARDHDDNDAEHDKGDPPRSPANTRRAEAIIPLFGPRGAAYFKNRSKIPALSRSRSHHRDGGSHRSEKRTFIGGVIMHPNQSNDVWKGYSGSQLDALLFQKGCIFDRCAVRVVRSCPSASPAASRISSSDDILAETGPCRSCNDGCDRAAQGSFMPVEAQQIAPGHHAEIVNEGRPWPLPCVRRDNVLSGCVRCARDACSHRSSPILPAQEISMVGIEFAWILRHSRRHENGRSGWPS